MLEEFKPYFFNMGIGKKQELFCISQAIRCRQEPTKYGPPRLVPNPFLGATIEVLKERAAKVISKEDVVSDPVEADQQATGIINPIYSPDPSFQDQFHWGHPPRHPLRYGTPRLPGNFHRLPVRPRGRGRGFYQHFPADTYTYRSYFPRPPVPFRGPAPGAPVTPVRAVRPPAGGSGAPTVRTTAPSTNKAGVGTGRGAPHSAPKKTKKSRAPKESVGGLFDIDAALNSHLEELAKLKENRDKRKVPGNEVACLNDSSLPDLGWTSVVNVVQTKT